ncbi:DUF479 domain-containing protein [Catenovulum sp. SM1970]|nr:acyl carrier protein phosphodiesterase [Marinifaba aquimaris]NTS78551.1 DUF479 domain-containing protein [Marinifaba aquimaris]
MGDFLKGVDQKSLSPEIISGIKNHQAIDKFTDSHPEVRNLKKMISSERKRFHGIITDIAFDHFLANEWHRFYNVSLNEFCHNTYYYLASSQQYIPKNATRLTNTVASLVKNQWLDNYLTLEGTSKAIDSVARRLRFDNNLSGGIDEIDRNYSVYRLSFLRFYPELIEFVEKQSIESKVK